MLEESSSLLPRLPSGKKLQVLTVTVREPGIDPAPNELESLLETLGVRAVAPTEVVLRKITPATYIGSGKVQEIKERIEASGADAVAIDAELSPNQLRNLEKAVGKAVIDRPGVILEIFSKHARTKEAKTQVELARLQYLLPRLAHYWTHFERQRGGSVGLRGMGEKQIEVDRRLVQKRIGILRGKLKEIEKERKVQRAGRREVLKVALVGYTNVGKSTLLNALTDSDVLVENKLFATLDASIRTLDPHSHPPVVAIDTVGFIRRIPTALIASFRSTLEELHEADLLLHVVDASARDAREQLDVTEEVLDELGLKEKPRLVVLNKIDRVKGPAGRNQARLIAPGAMAVSALNRADVVALRDAIMKHFKRDLGVWEIVVPYADGKLDAQLHAHGSIEATRPMKSGTFYKVRMHEGWARKLRLEKYRT